MNKRADASTLGTALPNFQRAAISDAEWELRVELAAAFRLAHHFGWDLLIYNFMSVRVPGPEGHMIMNPFGESYDEIKASSLLKIDREGNNLFHSQYRVSRAGFVIHGAIHDARPEIGCIMHIHTPAASAVCAMEEGLLPLDQEGMIFHDRVAYHGHQGIPLGDSERESIVRDLGDKQFMILRNHGLVTTGKTVGEAFTYMYFMELACRNQLAILSTGRKLMLPAKEVAARVPQQFVDHSEEYGGAAGRLEFASMMRRLDRIDPSYRT
jgi:ribulose-5-phosphate 4-epimerase/fuculose-1-phosphate aldolase